MRKVVVPLLLALPASLASPAAEPPGPTGMMNFYLEGASAEAEGRFAEARESFLAGLEQFPDSPHLQLLVARTSASLGDEQICLEALTRLAALGGRRDLSGIEPLQPYLDQPEFRALAQAMMPVDSATPADGTVWALEPADLWNEGIACDLATGDLFAGSVKHGKIVWLRDGTQEDFGTTARDELLEVIGLDVDEDRRHLWAAIGRDEAEPGAKHDFGEAPRENAIVVYDIATGNQIARHDLQPDERIHMWNDVAVAVDGTAYFTDMTVGEIHRIRPGGRPEPFHTLTDRNYPNGIAVSADGGLVYVACLEEIVIIEADSGDATRLISGPDVCTGLGDGIALGPEGLFIVQNNGLLGNRVLHCRLDDAGRRVTSARVLEVALPAGLMPYTCALGPDVLYVNGTAPFALYDEAEGPPASVIVEVSF